MTDYLKAGVDVESGNALVEKIRPMVKSTARSGVMGEIGSFGALFNLSALGKQYRNPILVSSTDGVGTKLLVAQHMSSHSSVGIDLVAMCVNDILTQGAEPLFFLDYFATGKLDQEIAASVIEGITQGCLAAQMALIGGETAEMPGMYDANKYDIAGFAVGIVENDCLLPKKKNMMAGDILIGLPSSGLHANGLSLVRKVLHDRNISYHDQSPWQNRLWGHVILEPTLIYVKQILPIIHLIKGLAHITGGGFTDNIPRILPEHLCAEIDLNAWQWPELFQWLQQEGEISTTEMLRTFNCGIGMVAVVDSHSAQILSNIFQQKGEKFYVLGSLQATEKADRIKYTNNCT